MEKLIVKMEQFGKDHWSLLAYVATRCVDYKGTLDINHLRLDGKQYPTILKGYFQDNSLCLVNHNDYDCLEDLENVKLVENKGTGLNPLMKITDKGWEVIKGLNKHKGNGGMYAEFVYNK